jgi:hypothetical protein
MYEMKKCMICLPVRTYNRYLDRVFENIESMKRIMLSKGYEVSVCVYGDKSVNKEGVKWLEEKEELKYRTWRIAKGRNELMSEVFKNDTELHIMMDGDEVCAGELKADVLLKYLDREDWDCLSFNRVGYYDIWALQYEPYIHHAWGLNNERLNRRLVENMRSDIIQRLSELNEGELMECYSAFNGFAIYRTKCFEGIVYDGETQKYFSEERLAEYLKEMEKRLNISGLALQEPTENRRGPVSAYENCEHISLHLGAIRKNGARIRIAKECLFV